MSALAATSDDAIATPPELERRLNLALVHLHLAISHALRTLGCAECSLESSEQRLGQHRARLRSLGYSVG